MSLTPKSLRELRRYLRGASDGLQDTADLIGTDDREQQRRLRGIAREIESEIAEIDRKISKAENDGGAK
jgi:hypothetical protein